MVIQEVVVIQAVTSHANPFVFPRYNSSPFVSVGWTSDEPGSISDSLIEMSSYPQRLDDKRLANRLPIQGIPKRTSVGVRRPENED